MHKQITTSAAAGARRNAIHVGEVILTYPFIAVRLLPRPAQIYSSSGSPLLTSRPTVPPTKVLSRPRACLACLPPSTTHEVAVPAGLRIDQMPSVPATSVSLVSVDDLAGLPIARPDLLSSYDSAAGPTPDPDMDDVILIPSDDGSAISQVRFLSPRLRYTVALPLRSKSRSRSRRRLSPPSSRISSWVRSPCTRRPLSSVHPSIPLRASSTRFPRHTTLRARPSRCTPPPPSRASSHRSRSSSLFLYSQSAHPSPRGEGQMPAEAFLQRTPSSRRAIRQSRLGSSRSAR